MNLKGTLFSHRAMPLEDDRSRTEISLARAKRLAESYVGNSLRYVRYLDDFPVGEVTTVWADTQTGAFTDPKIYVVQTNVKVIEALHPHDHRSWRPRARPDVWQRHDRLRRRGSGAGAGSPSTPAVCRSRSRGSDSSPPPSLTTNSKNRIADPPAASSTCASRTERGEEIGGIVPHITLKSIANDEPPDQEVLVDRPEKDRRHRPRHRPVRLRGDDPHARRLGRRRRRGLRQSAGGGRTAPSSTG